MNQIHFTPFLERCITVLIMRNKFTTHTMHYQQPDPAYFLTARKCQLFGVCCEAKSQQVNYLIDEAEYTGKGANTTISLVHHFLENHSLGEKHILLHCDNCVGQNKNNAFIFYLIWHILSNRHQSITLSFMLDINLLHFLS